MKIPNKRELQQIAFNHSSVADFQDFMYLSVKRTGKTYSFVVIDATLASDSPSRFIFFTDNIKTIHGNQWFN